jgi:nucleoside-diphosphate-sugar epimerase
VKVLCTGGCGYIGSVLVPKLLQAGHEVIVRDALWFGSNLPAHRSLWVVQSDIREGVYCEGVDAIIHLAGIANDPCGELDAKLTWEVNVLATLRLAEAAVRAGVKQFIFASSASVYGLKDNKPVVEDTELEPVSDYNKTKMVAERVLLSYADRMAVQIIRPATVCGVSPRQRFDVMVNALTIQALTKGEITAHCGEHGANLMRPNVHIDDICSAYEFMLERPHLTGCFNAGFENLSARDTAETIAEIIPAKITFTTVKDKRSYAVDSSKLLATGFQPKHTVRGAIRDIADAWHAGMIKDEPRTRNLQWMRSQRLVAG